MKTLKKLLYIIPLLGAMITSCTDVENIEVEHIGGYNTLGDSEYYANLRAYKETAKNYGRPVAFRCNEKRLLIFSTRQYGYHLHVEWCSGKI